jgi:hypothetical protein
MLRNILIAIVAASVLAPLAFVPIGASAQSMSVVPTFSPATIQMPRTNQPTFTPTYAPTYSSPSANSGWDIMSKARLFGFYRTVETEFIRYFDLLRANRTLL